MSMLPRVFPEVEGLDMYASMDPAREVGGDLYSFLQKEDELYFCIGVAVARACHLTLLHGPGHTFCSTAWPLTARVPAEIATRRNAELVEDNEQGVCSSPCSSVSPI